MLAERNKIQIKVFYTWNHPENGLKYDPGFGRNIEWDIPLLEGYKYEFVHNTSKNPGTRNHKGIINPQLLKKIEQYNPDTILVNGWNFDSHLKCLKHFHKKIPVLFRGDSTLLNERNGIRKILRRIVLKWVYRNVDFALYAGTQNKKYFLKNGLKENQLIFTPHAIENARFMQPGVQYNNAAIQWRKKLEIDENDLVFLYAGKFEDIKNPMLIVEVAKLFSDFPVHFIIAGNGPKEKLLKGRAGKNVTFIDFQNQKMMPVLYRLSDVFILPSKSETWGLSVNEAMACGKPVLVSGKCGCAVDLVEDGKNGFVFQSGNVDDLAKKIKAMIEQKNNLKNMGEASLQKIKNWSFEKIAEQIEELVLSL